MTPQRLGIAAGALVLTVAVVVTGALLRPSSDPLVPDGGDPSACVSDAYPVAEIPIATKNGAPVGTLQLQHSARCRTSWGRLAYTSRQPPQGWDVLLTVTRPSDGRHEEQAAHLLAHAVFTGTVHPGQSCLVVSAEVKNSPGGAVKTASPCVKP